jgi:hypothetical protein
MSKRLPAVLELPESCSESSSPGHKRSRTQQRSRPNPSQLTSDEQVWQIIQSRRNIDRKVRKVQSRIKTTRDSSFKPVSTIESPLPSTLSNSELFKKALDKKKLEIKRQKEQNKEKNKENKEKIHEKGKIARMKIKKQYVLDLEFIKKRDVEIQERKKEIVKKTQLESRMALEKRKNLRSAFREVSSSEYLNRIQKIHDLNRVAEESIRALEAKQDQLMETLRSKSVMKINCSGGFISSYSAANSPRSYLY